MNGHHSTKNNEENAQQDRQTPIQLTTVRLLTDATGESE